MTHRCGKADVPPRCLGTYARRRELDWLQQRCEADMKKGTMLLIGVIILILGGLVYQFLLHPNPYTGQSPAEESGVVDPN